MQITSKHIRPGVKGYALTITLIFLAVVLTIFASILNWTSSNAKVTLRNNQYNMSQAAAEAAVERVIGQMDRDFINLSILNSSNNSSLPAGIDLSTWPVQYAFSGTNGVANQITVNIGPPATNTIALNSQYSGLYGLAQSIDVIATATPIGQPQNVPATVHESLQLALVPLYQFAIFYNVNLEIAPGAPMTITGPVFCNQSIWEGANNATFSSTVTAVGTNCGNGRRKSGVIRTFPNALIAKNRAGDGHGVAGSNLQVDVVENGELIKRNQGKLQRLVDGGRDILRLAYGGGRCNNINSLRQAI